MAVASITFDHPLRLQEQKLRQMVRPRTANPSQLELIARGLNELAYRVETRWDEESHDNKTILKAFAYMIIEPPRGRDLIGAFFSGLSLLFVALKEGAGATRAVLNAQQRFVDAVLCAVERENADYQGMMDSAVSLVQSGMGSAKVIEPGRVSDFLASIPD